MRGKHQFMAALNGTREGWPDEMTAEEKRIMVEHYHYLVDLTNEGKVVMAGPCFGLFGMIVLEVDSEKEAKEIMAEEPSVVQGVHTYEMYPMKVSLMREKPITDRYVADPSDKVLTKEIVVDAPREQIWHAWTTNQGIKSFLTDNVNIRLEIGGPYEILFVMDNPVGQRGGEGCRILSFLPMEMLSFEWNAPPQFGDLRSQHTRVVLQFEELGEKKTAVKLSHLGWGKGEKWDELYAYFESAWTNVLASLKSSLERN